MAFYHFKNDFMSKLKRNCCVLLLLVFGTTGIHAQQLSIGSNVFLNSTTFDFDGNTNPNSQFASAGDGRNRIRM
jgi:hypothetical protein